MSVTDNPRDEGLVLTLWDSAFRNGEACVLNVENYRPLPRLEGQPRLAWLTLPDRDEEDGRGELKTVHANRGVKLSEAVPALDVLMACHPVADHPLFPKAPLFYSTNTTYYVEVVHKATRDRQRLREWERARSGPRPELELRLEDLEKLRLTEDGIRGIIRRLMKRARLGKRCTPHLIRHSRIAYFKKRGVSGEPLRRWAGWSDSSNMESEYGAITQNESNNVILRATGVDIPLEEEDATFTPRTCRCGEQATFRASFCPSCGARLADTAGAPFPMDGEFARLVADDSVREGILDVLMRNWEEVEAEVKKRRGEARG